jgi:hypothetical protein
MHVDEVTDQVIRRDRDDSMVAEFESAAPGVHVVDSTFLSLEGDRNDLRIRSGPGSRRQA